jgi:hypothetical protein
LRRGLLVVFFAIELLDAATARTLATLAGRLSVAAVAELPRSAHDHHSRRVIVPPDDVDFTSGVYRWHVSTEPIPTGEIRQLVRHFHVTSYTEKGRGANQCAHGR